MTGTAADTALHTSDLQILLTMVAFAVLLVGSALVSSRYRRRVGKRRPLNFDLSERMSLSKIPLMHYDKIEWLLLLVTALIFLGLAYVAALMGQ